LIAEQTQMRIWAYLDGTAKNIGLESFAFGGIADHVHGLVGLTPTIKVGDVVQKLKANSSRWMKQEFGIDFSWQANYAAYSVSVSHVGDTIAYIRNQREHHKKRNFRAEMRAILRKHGIPEDDIFI
jgi:putative transposase